MDLDLISACIFCSTFLFRTELPPVPKLSGEFGLSYTTLARELASPSTFGHDESDVTDKFALLGLRSVPDTPADLGAGTPASEWRLRLAIGNSHDELNRKDRAPGQVQATGTGRADNYSGLFRRQIGAHDSLEAGFEQRIEKITDLVNLGGSNYEFSEERTLLAQRVDVALGWRHRGPGWEASAGGLAVRPEGQYNTALSYRRGSAWLYGPEAEFRLARGGWNFALDAEESAANMPVSEESAPVFARVKYNVTARLEAAGATIQKSWGSTDLFLSAYYDRSELPYVVVAVLGEETRDFDAGLRPFSTTREWVWDLEARREVAPGVHARIFVRMVSGNESVRLVDPSMSVASGSLSVRRGKGFTQFILGGGADFSIGTPTGAGPLHLRAIP